MKDISARIIENERIALDTYRLRLEGNFGLTNQGQFVNLKIDGYYLRRPISVSEYDEKSITIIYRIAGKGTKVLSDMKSGEQIQVLTPLGNGFEIKDDQDVLVLGGGVGTAPMIGLSKALKDAGKDVTCILGFNTEGEVFGEKELEEYGVDVHVCTADGSYGEKGFVTDILDKFTFTRFYICGPEPMLKAVDLAIDKEAKGSLSFEARMGCGFGACMGCSCETKYGNMRICKEGPVLEREVVKW